MRRPRHRRLGQVETLEPRCVLDSTVVFNEIMYNPPGTTETLEFIELHNQQAINMDLSGWRLDGGVNFTFAEGTIVPGGGYLVIATDPVALQTATTGLTGVRGPYVGQLDNDGEQIELRDRTGRFMDQIDYGDEGNWPVAADGSGASLAKIRSNTASDSAESWTFSPQVGGTPGARNFPEAGGPAQSHELVSADAMWDYESTGTDLGTNWRNLAFDSSSWLTGQSVFYAGTGELAPALIGGVSATASTEYTPDGRLALDAVNGNGLIGNLHSSDVGSMWLSNGPTDPAPLITFDLGAVYALDTMRVWNYNEYRPDLAGRVLELLGRGVDQLDILIAGENQVYTPLFTDYHFPVVTTTTTGADFSHTVDFNGARARYVRFDIDSNHNGKDYNNPADTDGFGNFVGLSEVQFVGEPRRTQAALGPAAHYFRREFNFADDPARTELLLNAALDDGAVYYLNGVEIYRHNMPAGAVSYSTPASTPVNNPSFSGQISVPNGGLVQGTNVLAVEVHQISPVDGDMLFGAELTAVVSPPDPEELEIGLAFNEVSGPDSPFSLELINTTGAAMEVGGFVIQSSAGGEHVLAAQSLPAGGFLTLTGAQLGITPADAEKLFLLSPSRSLVADGVEIKLNPRARMPDGTGEWLRPDVLTPGAANSFDLADEIVINEIMYHHRPNYPTPPTYNIATAVPFDATWKYNRTGQDLGTTWYQTNHAVDGVNWLTGQGLLGVEPDTLPLLPPINTTWTLDPPIITYYFQTEFQVTGDVTGAQLRMRHVVDDGAVFYLNGEELTRLPNNTTTRHLLPGGTINYNTQPSFALSNASVSSLIELNPVRLVTGTNVLSVEVHQYHRQTQPNTDVLFGMELVLQSFASPPIAFADVSEEWIELYNRSAIAVDLTGWSLDAAANFDFPPGTTIGPGEYLVVTGDSAALAAKYPAIDVVGDFSGSLSNSTDRILLRDTVGNPADEVRYYEDGRWPAAADAGGSSLELRSPLADNSVAEAWAASNEGSRSTWQNYTYSGVAAASAVGPDGTWQELDLGMLDDGEVLLDDIRVVRNPGPSGVQILQNSTFDGDTVGGPASGWRFLGNHRHSQVILDPENAANKVLRLVSTDQTEHMHNHLEAIFIAGQTIANGVNYEISFRAKWITGSPQLNSRLYFNRLPETTIIRPPAQHGTPGAVNSTFTANVGPTYYDFRHEAAVPAPTQSVTVTVRADDPDGVAAMTLRYSVNSGAFATAPMTHQGDGEYVGIIPGQTAGAIVQFYVEGQDSLGAVSTYPAAGPNSRALYKVNDGLASTTGIHNFRIIVTPADAAWLHTNINLMSNDLIPATVIYDEREVFYNVGLRLSGSERARPFDVRLGFFVSFPTEQLFRGVQGSVIFDRSDSTGYGQREILVTHATNHAGVVPTPYNDLVHIMTPLLTHTGGALMEMSRFTDVFLEAQFENGGDGRLYELEYIYFPLTANAQGYKFPQPDDVRAIAVQNMGDDPENYRWTYLIKNNRAEDDYSRLIQWAKVMGTTGATYTSQIASLIDVDQWLRAGALAAASGYGDQYGGDGANHNGQFYIRPEDNRVLYFPHDVDAFFSTTRVGPAGLPPLVGHSDINKVLGVSFNNSHNYYGHVHDIVTSSYNGTYMAPFASNFATLIPSQPWSSWMSELSARANFVLSTLNTSVPMAAYTITTPGPLNVGAASTATINGTGWVNVRELRLAGSDRALPVTWTTNTAWRITIPVDHTTGVVMIEAYDFRGNLLGTRSITITSTAPRPIIDQLRLVELMYNSDGDDDASEYIELTNISAAPIASLAGVRFTSGLSFTFPNIPLAPGERILVVRDQAGFQARYGTGLPVVGTYTGSVLDNGGERIILVDADGAVIQDFTYNDNGDGWHPTTDGDGFSLVTINESTDPATWSGGTAWRSSFEMLGSPGEADQMLGDFDLNNRVDAADMALLQSRLGTASGATKLTGDLTGDGAVDRDDVNQFVRRFGRSFTPPVPPPSPSVAAPAAVVARSASRSPATLQATAHRDRRAATLNPAGVDAAISATTEAARRPLRAYATRSLAKGNRDFGPDSPPSSPSPK